jgi:hypothetical protein
VLTSDVFWGIRSYQLGDTAEEIRFKNQDHAMIHGSDLPVKFRLNVEPCMMDKLLPSTLFTHPSPKADHITVSVESICTVTIVN